MDHILKDSRFSHIPADPRFKRIPKWEMKVKIDKRFRRMFSDSKFKVKYTTDKRGRPANTTSAEDLKRYYAISSDEEEEDGSSDSDSGKREEGEEGPSGAQKSSPPSTAKSKKASKQGSKEVGSISKASNKRLSAVSAAGGSWEEEDIGKSDDGKESSDEEALPPRGKDGGSSSDDEGIDVGSRRMLSEDVKKKLCNLSVDYARGEGALFTDSSSDDESTDDGSESDVEHKWGELDKDADTTEDASRRLAVCNMDWDRIRAQDLLVLLSSFLPATGGAICSVTIYPSEFGLQRMKEEEVNGPPELREGKEGGKADSGDELNGGDDEETEEGRKYHMEKLRQYQLNRLKYYYAVVECDGVATAEHLYKECDGLEYESSATRLDLRFIPDDMTFDQEPHDSCTSLPEPGQYSPQHFTTTALQQAKVDLTWDETDPRRVALAKKLQSADPNEVPDADLQAYLASDTSGEDSAEEEAEAKEEEKSDKEDEDSNADPILKYRQLLLEAEQQENERKKKAEGVEMEVTWGLGLREKTEKLVKEKQKAAALEQATPFQQILEKRKEKRKLKREQRKKLQNGEQGSDEEAEDQQPFSDDDVPSDVDMSDPFFREEMENLGVKKGKGGKRKKKESDDSEEDEEGKQGKAELELLMLDEEPSDRRHFSLKKIQDAEDQSKKKKKRLKKKRKEEQAGESVEDDFQVNVEDERFQALFTSHHYNIDPADPHYRKTKGTEALRQAKLSRWNQENGSSPSAPVPATEQQNRKDTELSQLVKSVKRNTKNLRK